MGLGLGGVGWDVMTSLNLHGVVDANYVTCGIGFGWGGVGCNDILGFAHIVNAT